jgi:hypothetical protein
MRTLTNVENAATSVSDSAPHIIAAANRIESVATRVDDALSSVTSTVSNVRNITFDTFRFAAAITLLSPFFLFYLAKLWSTPRYRLESVKSTILEAWAAFFAIVGTCVAVKSVMTPSIAWRDTVWMHKMITPHIQTAITLVTGFDWFRKRWPSACADLDTFSKVHLEQAYAHMQSACNHSADPIVWVTRDKIDGDVRCVEQCCYRFSKTAKKWLLVPSGELPEVMGDVEANALASGAVKHYQVVRAKIVAEHGSSVVEDYEKSYRALFNQRAEASNYDFRTDPALTWFRASFEPMSTLSSDEVKIRCVGISKLLSEDEDVLSVKQGERPPVSAPFYRLVWDYITDTVSLYYMQLAMATIVVLLLLVFMWRKSNNDPDASDFTLEAKKNFHARMYAEKHEDSKYADTELDLHDETRGRYDPVRGQRTEQFAFYDDEKVRVAPLLHAEFFTSYSSGAKGQAKHTVNDVNSKKTQIWKWMKANGYRDVSKNQASNQAGFIAAMSKARDEMWKGLSDANRNGDPYSVSDLYTEILNWRPGGLPAWRDNPNKRYDHLNDLGRDYHAEVDLSMIGDRGDYGMESNLCPREHEGRQCGVVDCPNIHRLRSFKLEGMISTSPLIDSTLVRDVTFSLVNQSGGDVMSCVLYYNHLIFEKHAFESGPVLVCNMRDYQLDPLILTITLEKCKILPTHSLDDIVAYPLPTPPGKQRFKCEEPTDGAPVMLFSKLADKMYASAGKVGRNGNLWTYSASSNPGLCSGGVWTHNTRLVGFHVASGPGHNVFIPWSVGLQQLVTGTTQWAGTLERALPPVECAKCNIRFHPNPKHPHVTLCYECHYKEQGKEFVRNRPINDSQVMLKTRSDFHRSTSL